VLGLDFLLLAAMQVGDEPDQARIAVRPCFQGPRPQPARRMRGEHAHADFFDDVPDVVEVVVVGHAKSILGASGRFPWRGLVNVLSSSAQADDPVIAGPNGGYWIIPLSRMKTRVNSHLPLDQGALDVGDGLRRIEDAWGRPWRNHDGWAAVEAERVFQIVETLAGFLVARIDDPALRLQQGGGPR